jgi:hypothetical protein
MKKSFFGIVSLLFVVISAAIYLLYRMHPEYDLPALLVANTLIALLSVLSYFMIQRQLKSARPQAFVNGVYGATLLKLMVCMGAIFGYLYTNREHLHKPSIFVILGIYMAYTLSETLLLSAQARKKD